VGIRKAIPDFIALLTAHIPNAHEKSVIYYGWYSNRSRGERRKIAGTSAGSPGPELAEGEGSGGCPWQDDDADAARAPLSVRRAWAAMIRRVYEVDPLVCPKCSGEMKIVSFIEDEDVIYAILHHLGLLVEVVDAAERSPPEAGDLRGHDPIPPSELGSCPQADPKPTALDSITYDLCESFPA